MTTAEKISSFFKEVYVELRKTNWLGRREVLRLTLVVLGVTIAAAVFLGGLDYLFSEGLKGLIFK